MPRVSPGRRFAPLALALTAYDLWRRLPEPQRRQLAAAARRHGPRLASQAAKAAVARRPRRRTTP